MSLFRHFLIYLSCLCAIVVVVRSEGVAHMSTVFMWASDRRFGGSNAYKVHPHNPTEIVAYLDHPEEDASHLPLNVVYVLEELNSDLIPQYAQSGHLDFLQEMMTVSGSSMVMSKVDVSEDVSIFDLLDEISDASFTFPSPELSPTWALREASKTSAFSIDAVKETIAGGLTATVLVPLYISDANEVIRSVEDATGSIDHVSIVAALNPFATGDHRSGGGRKLLSAKERMLAATSSSNSTDFSDYIYMSADGTAGMLFGLVMVWVIVLATSCTMDIQCPSQIWTHRDLPLKGRVDRG